MADDQARDHESDGELPEELLDLVWDLNEGLITPADAARLSEMLLAESGNRTAYLRFMQIIAAMEWEGVAASSESIFPKEVEEGESPLTARGGDRAEEVRELAKAAVPAKLDAMFSGWGRFSRPLVAAICASLAAVATVLGLQHFGVLDGPLRDAAASADREDVPIAYLTSAIGFSFGKDSPRLQQVGSPVNLGDEVTLQEGIAKFQLSSGVLVSLEGPAGLVLTSPNSVVLQYGKLTSSVPRGAGGLKVLAGASRLTAREGEFGVHLTGGDVDVHVFSGQVLAVNASFMDQRGGFEEFYGEDRRAIEDRTEEAGVLNHVVVDEGRSLSLSDSGDAVGIVGWGEADDMKFATRLPTAEPLPIGTAYVDAVSSSKPIGYWRFESTANETVKNEAPQGDDLHVVGKVQLSGDEGNHVVQLGSSASNGFLAASKTTDRLSGSDYSVEVWMRPSHFHAAAVVMLAAISAETRDERPGFYLGLHGVPNSPSAAAARKAQPWSVRFLNRDPPSGDVTTGVSLYSETSYQPRRWQHVVAVKRGERMELYVNGAVAAEGVDERTLAPGLRLIVGEASTTQRTYPFRGQLDELALYDRALSAAEIGEHFRAVRLESQGKVGARPDKLDSML